MADFFSMILDFFFQNILYFAAAGVAIFLIFTYFKFSTRTKVSTVNRAEVERVEFIKRMKENPNTEYKMLMRGRDVFGKIKAMRIVSLERPGTKANPEATTIKVIQMVIKPTMFRTIFEKPFSKELCFQIMADKVERFDPQTKDIILPATMSFDYLFGIYYDGSDERIHTDFIKQDNIFRSDLNQLASVYFAKSQEQSTFDPEHAHELAMKEKEVQIELSKKKGQLTAI